MTTDTDRQDPPWLYEGAKVAVLSNGNTRTVRLATVTRITKTRIVIDDGTRYRRDDLQEATTRGSHRWFWTFLQDPSDPMVAEVHRMMQRKTAMRMAQAAVEEWRNHDDDAYAREALRIIQAELDQGAQK